MADKTENPAVQVQCAHCRNGWFAEQQFGQDVKCVNGVLIDIDVVHEGWQRDLLYPVAPCHPQWSAQKRNREFDNDCQARLAEWASWAEAEPENADGK